MASALGEHRLPFVRVAPDGLSGVLFRAAADGSLVTSEIRPRDDLARFAGRDAPVRVDEEPGAPLLIYFPPDTAELAGLRRRWAQLEREAKTPAAMHLVQATIDEIADVRGRIVEIEEASIR
jgi:hypothetical protein